MLFNSIDFALFLPIVFILYWFITNRNLKLQNVLVVVSSYVFYAWWDWRFLSLIFISTLVDYTVGRTLGREENPKNRKVLLLTSICVNLGLLGFFKYFNFFAENFSEAFSLFGADFKISSLEIVLPVGISFYTFQTLSYTIDVYKRNLVPTYDFVAFSAFVSFFPQLVAGPIERATQLLPQFLNKRQFEYSKAVDGMRQVLWGLFKKIVIADNCADYVNLIFNPSADFSGSMLVIGAVLFAFQIYGDFSGYSDIAIGTARLFGFNLMKNFAFPYFSRDIAEFWRRWHISLSTWFRDYLYIPLGGSRGGLLARVRNIFIIFIVSGFWHGANWTFIVWGALNAFYFLPLLLTKNNRNHLDTVAQGKWIPDLKELFSVLLNFMFVVFGWIFFRAENMHHALDILKKIFSSSLLTLPRGVDFIGVSVHPLIMFILLFVFVIIEWLGREREYAFDLKFLKNRALRWAISVFLAIVIMESFSTTNSQEFIYFDF